MPILFYTLNGWKRSAGEPWNRKLTNTFPGIIVMITTSSMFVNTLVDDAGGGTRTRNPGQEPAPKAGAFTSFATPAALRNVPARTRTGSLDLSGDLLYPFELQALPPVLGGPGRSRGSGLSLCSGCADTSRNNSPAQRDRFRSPEE